MAYLTDRQKADVNRHHYEKQLSALRVRLVDAMSRANDNELAVVRARRMFTLMNSYISLKNASQVSLRSYDDAVLSAMMTYVEKSAKAASATVPEVTQ